MNTPIAGLPLLLASSLKVAIMFGVVMLTVAYTTLAERRISAFIQDRLGPNRVGPFGLLLGYRKAVGAAVVRRSGHRDSLPVQI